MSKSEMTGFRQQVVDALRGESQTIAQLSDALGITDARILFHAGQLAEAHTIQLTRNAEDPRHWICTLTATPEQQDSLEPRDSPMQVRNTVQDFSQAYFDFVDGAFGIASTVLLGRESGTRLSEEQAAEFARRLQNLADEYFLPGRGDQTGTKYGFFTLLLPVDLHPLGDSIQTSVLLETDSLEQFAKSIFVDEVEVYPAYARNADFDSLLNPGDFVKYTSEAVASMGSAHVVVRYTDCGPQPQVVQIEPEVFGSPGKKFTHAVLGWGLMHIEFRRSKNSPDIRCRIVSNTRERASSEARETFAICGDPGVWDWAAVERHALRLKNQLEILAKPV